MDTPLLTVSAAPHIRSIDSIPKTMWTVVATVTPAAVFSVFNFGIPALVVIVACIVGALVSEALLQYWQKKEMTLDDGSAFLTGLLLALCLPPALPWYMAVMGSVVAITLAKHAMGGLGQNIFNPAHVGRAFLMASYPLAMTTWSVSRLWNNNMVDAVTTATPLGILKMQGYAKLIEVFGSKHALYQTMLLGNRGGSLGETASILLILGGLYLIKKDYIQWQVPAVMIGTVGFITWVFGGQSGFFSGDPLFHMLAGGLILGAFFMATDMVTTPTTLQGKIIFAGGAGCITALIRLVGGYPEGVCYSILLMNALTPMIDKYVVLKRFGVTRERVKQ